jgi:hypothetical protein
MGFANEDAFALHHQPLLTARLCIFSATDEFTAKRYAFICPKA